MGSSEGRRFDRHHRFGKFDQTAFELQEQQLREVKREADRLRARLNATERTLATVVRIAQPYAAPAAVASGNRPPSPSTWRVTRK